jgi:hypothetical protein
MRAECKKEKVCCSAIAEFFPLPSDNWNANCCEKSARIVGRNECVAQVFRIYLGASRSSKWLWI